MCERKKNMTVVAVLAASYLVQLTSGVQIADVGYYDGCPVICRVWFSLFHANALHLACNCYAIYFCLNGRMMPYRALIPFLLAVAFIASWFSNACVPTVGASAAIFAMVGLNMTGCGSSKYWILTAISLSVGFVIPAVNGMAHLAAFVPGFLTGRAILFYRRISNDHRAAHSGK